MKIRLKYLLDTHALLWAAIDDERLSAEAGRILATTPYDQLAISDISLQEVGLLAHGGRIKSAGSHLAALRHMLEYVTVLPITLEIGLLAPTLALPHGDQFDHVIAATAKLHKLTLITKDANITDSGVVNTLW